MKKLMLVALVLSIQSVHAAKKADTRGRPTLKKDACTLAYEKGHNSGSTGLVIEAIEACEVKIENICKSVQKANGGAETGDGRYVAAECRLISTYAAYEAVSKHLKDESCESAYKAGHDSGSTGLVYTAVGACEEATNNAIVAAVGDMAGTGDGRYVGAEARLESVIAGVKAISKLK